MKPLTKLTRKNEIFEWNEACEAAFQKIKKAVIQVPVLSHFDSKKKSYLETDFSDYVFLGVLSQIGDDGLLYPVAFFFKKLIAAECNYDIYDKKLLAIIRCFEE